MLPARSDSPLSIAVAHARYSELLDAGVKIYEIRDVVLHSKTVVVDGVWSAIPDAELATIVGDTRDLRAACSRLLALANERGGRDNATALLARIETVAE